MRNLSAAHLQTRYYLKRVAFGTSKGGADEKMAARELGRWAQGSEVVRTHYDLTCTVYEPETVERVASLSQANVTKIYASGRSNNAAAGAGWVIVDDSGSELSSDDDEDD